MSIEQNLENTSSYIDNMYDSFLGTYRILPEQFIHLNDYNVIISENEFKILNNDLEPKIFTYNINKSRIRYHKSEVLPSMKINLTSLSKYNITNNDIISELLENVLYLSTPTTIYLTYHPKYKLYSIKNLNMATLFLMEKIND
jgi:hypothetical protein